MPTRVTDIAELSAERVQQELDFITALTQEEHPEIDAGFGPLHKQVLLPGAEHAAANQEDVDRYRRSSTLKAINEDPTLADNDQVDAVLSNKGIVRRAGSPATGNITLVVSELVPVTIASGTQFVASGKAFVVEEAYAAKTDEENVDADTDRVLTPMGDGNYSFTIPVVAEETGSGSLLTKGTLVESSTTISNLVKIYAAEDFLGGLNTETNEQLLVREQEGWAAKALSNRVNGAALLREQDDFKDYVALSIIGLGDAEMLRDQHSIFPGSFGGRTDWYLKTTELPQAVELTKVATLVEKTSDGKGIWQFAVTRDDAPGYYDVLSITPNTAEEFVGSFTITSETRNVDLTAISGELLPDIEETIEGVYSRLQTVVVRFKDSETDTDSLTVATDTAEYLVTLRAMPQIAEVQTLLASRKHRNFMGDVLVKAPVPCYLSLAFTLQGKPGAAMPDVYALRSALAQYVNRLPFTGRLYASALQNVIHSYLTDGVTVGAIDMFGQILRPNGTIKPLRSTEALVVPDEPTNMVSARTVSFFLPLDQIKISAVTLNVPEVL